MHINRLQALKLDFLTDTDRSIFYAMAKKEIKMKQINTGRYQEKPMTERQKTQYHRILNKVIDHFKHH